jgi:colanic acid/amylovoran biosynthesis glycosyltransferase
MNLILFSATYPFDGGPEQTFYDPEMKHLNRVFDRIILVPKKVIGNCLPLPDRVTVDTSYYELLTNTNPLSLIGKVFGSDLLYRELLSRPSLIFYPQALIRMVRFLAVAWLTLDWVDAWVRKNGIDEKNVFYTYWFDSSSFGIGMAKRKYPNLRVISRAHGYDIYEEIYYNPPYWPFRNKAMALLDALIPDAEAGRKYLAQKYPDHASIIQTDWLGVPPSGFLNPQVTDHIFRIISCSMLVPVKRIELLMEGILRAAMRRPEQRFEWVHMGNGEPREKLQKYADEKFPPNATANFNGYTTRADLMEFYRKNPLDVFINVSVSEGTPVSIMEAASCGIPVIATKVGGNPEIALDENGLLLAPNPTPDEIADAFFAFIDSSSMSAAKRKGSYEVWARKFNSEENYRQFAERLRSIGEG